MDANVVAIVVDFVLIYINGVVGATDDAVVVVGVDDGGVVVADGGDTVVLGVDVVGVVVCVRVIRVIFVVCRVVHVELLLLISLSWVIVLLML